MGCVSSKTLEAAIHEYEELQDKSKLKFEEQQNLLRFKIEVLVNMLGIEEKKSESLTKRVETLKWILLTQGVSEQTLTTIVQNSDTSTSTSKVDNNLMNNVEKNIANKNISMIDLSGSISRMKEEFDRYPEDILKAFAETDGKIISNITIEDFMKQLFTTTEKISKSDIQVLFYYYFLF
jgi:hypothetical protein